VTASRRTFARDKRDRRSSLLKLGRPATAQAGLSPLDTGRDRCPRTSSPRSGSRSPTPTRTERPTNWSADTQATSSTTTPAASAGGAARMAATVVSPTTPSCSRSTPCSTTSGGTRPTGAAAVRFEGDTAHESRRFLHRPGCPRTAFGVWTAIALDITPASPSSWNPRSLVLARVAQNLHADTLVVGVSHHRLRRFVGSAGSH
jgi:hypothetical protein